MAITSPAATVPPSCRGPTNVKKQWAGPFQGFSPAGCGRPPVHGGSPCPPYSFVAAASPVVARPRCLSFFPGPSGARSSHWYMPQQAVQPRRAYRRVRCGRRPCRRPWRGGGRELPLDDGKKTGKRRAFPAGYGWSAPISVPNDARTAKTVEKRPGTVLGRRPGRKSVAA